MKNFKDVKVGDWLVCVNPEEWDGEFVKGGAYEVEGTWGDFHKDRIIGGVYVLEKYAKDFMLECRSPTPCSPDVVTILADRKPHEGCGMEGVINSNVSATQMERKVQESREGGGEQVADMEEGLTPPSGYVTKTTYQSTGDVEKTTTYHFEKYEDFQRYEDSLDEEDYNEY